MRLLVTLLFVYRKAYSGVALRRLAEVAQGYINYVVMYQVYALHNKDSDKIYIGQTENLEVRLKLHKDKTFTKGYTAKNDGKWELVYNEVVNSRKDALKREKQLKSYRGRKFIRKMIQ